MVSVLALLFLSGKKGKSYQGAVGHHCAGFLFFLKSQWILMVLKTIVEQNYVLTFDYWFKCLKIFILNFILTFNIIYYYIGAILFW